MTTATTETSTTSGYGRGMLLLALANAAYIVTAYAVTTITARVLEPTEFGAFGLIMAWITVLTALLVKGLATTTAREMAGSEQKAATAWHAGRVLGIRMAGSITILGLLLSPLAAHVLGAGEDRVEFGLGALAAITFGVNAVLLAWPTGRRNYAMQAWAQVAYAVARVLLVVGGAWAFGLIGAVVGYVLAPLLASLPLVTRHPRPTGDVAKVLTRMSAAVVPVSIVSIAVTCYFIVDIFALSAVVGSDDPSLGVYVAYGTVAHVPYFLLQAASVAIVPALAASAAGALRMAAIRRTMTDVLVLLAGPTALLVVAGDAAARVIFGAEYEAFGVVAPLALATAGVTIIANLVAIDVAIGRLRSALAITLGGVALVAAAAWYRADVAGGDASEVANAVLVATAVPTLLLALHVRVRHSALFEVRRTFVGLALAGIAAVPPLLVEDDLPRMLVAGGCGIAWLAAATLLRVVDVRRGSVVATDAEHA